MSIAGALLWTGLVFGFAAAVCWISSDSIYYRKNRRQWAIAAFLFAGLALLSWLSAIWTSVDL